MTTDNIPPGRVTDLLVNNLPDRIAVQFTAPGDDLDSNDKAASYVVKYSSTLGNLTGANFDGEEFNTLLTNGDLVDSTLDPEVGGIRKTFLIKDSIFTAGVKYALALKAVDEIENQGPVSNIVQIFLPGNIPPIHSNITCFQDNKKCEIENDNLIEMIVGTTWQECQLLCEDEQECLAFNFYGPESNFIPHNACLLFSECGSKATCEDCVFGSTQQQCTCGIDYYGLVDTEN